MQGRLTEFCILFLCPLDGEQFKVSRSDLYIGIRIVHVVVVEDVLVLAYEPRIRHTSTSYTSQASLSPGRLRRLMSLSRSKAFFFLSASAVYL